MYCWFDGPWLHSIVLNETGQLINKFRDTSPTVCRAARSGARIPLRRAKDANISPDREVSGSYRIVCHSKARVRAHAVQPIIDR
jgi:hypothetical protein